MSKTLSYSNLSTYVGRFAPSPSGPLHMGSLICGLASFLDARAQGGQWLVRIEDIDPPREQEGADNLILATLRAHGLQWDGDVSYQSQHSDRFNIALDFLCNNALSYRCSCTRKRVAALGGVYDRHCLSLEFPKATPCALRLNLAAACQRLGLPETIEFDDRIQGLACAELVDDFIIRRKDGLFAYQLAVVVDDIAQGITDVVRGYDLFDMTASQILFTRLLGGSDIRYAHIPVLVDGDGCKLSKQSHANPIDNHQAGDNLLSALRYLQHPPPQELAQCRPTEILRWAIDHWQIEKLRGLKSVTLAESHPY